jgi:hypothetical protein
VARFQVGEAFLQVKPSLRRLHKDIGDEVNKWRDLDIDVGANMQRFHSELNTAVSQLDSIEIDVEPNMAGFRQQVEAGTRGQDAIEIDVNADMAGFHDRVRAETANMPEIEVPVRPDVDTTKARADIGAFATQMRATLTAAIRSLPEIELTAESDQVTREIQQIRAELMTLRDADIGFDIDDAEAYRRIKALEVRLTALSARKVHIKAEFDAGTAAAKLGAFSLLADNAGRSGNFLTRSMAAVGGAAISSVAGIGDMVSGLGGMIGEGNKAGSAITGLGTSIASGATSMTKFAGPIGTVVTTLAVFGPMVLAAAGAAGLAVAGISQLGGAAVALGSGLVPLGGLLGTLPGLIAPVGLAAGVLAIAFGDAGLKAEVEGLKKSFEPLINDVRNQMRPALTELINTVETLVPLFQRVAPVVTSALSDVTRGFSNILKETSFQRDLEMLLTSAGNNIRGFGIAGQSAFRGVIDMAVAAQPAVNQLVDYVQQGAQSFAEMMAEGRRSGELAAFFQQGVDVLKQLIDLVGNAAGLFKDLWDSSARTGAFTSAIEAINGGITRMRDYVSQAGGSWDQLMQKVGPIVTQVVDLIGTIGAAFVEVGAKVDLGPAFEGAKAAINGIKGPLADVAQAASDVVGKLGPAAGELAEMFGPGVADNIRRMGDYLGAFLQILENMGPTIGILGTIFDDVFSSIGIAILAVTTSLDGIISVLRAGFEVITGDWSAAGDIMSDFAGRARDSGQAMGDLAFGSDAASTSVDGLGTSIGNVPQPPIIRFNVEASDALAKSQGVNAAIQIVPQSWFTKFIGDPTGLNEAIAQATDGIRAVEPQHLTAFLGDTGNILASSAQADASIQAVDLFHLTGFTGDTGNILAAAGQATGGINAVPPNHHTPITGDAASAVGESMRAGGALNGIPRPAPIPINVQDNASGPISNILSKLGQIVGRVWTAIVNAAPGGAAGMIVAPMATGGVIEMQRGDNLTPMRGGIAQFVPPNTWRVIGDRMKDIEAYIPVNNSALSQTILAQTAQLMGRAVVPRQLMPLLRLLGPILGLASGRVLMTDDSGQPISWAPEPAVPTSTAYRTGRRGRDPSRAFDLITQLFERLLIPQLQNFGERTATTGRSMTEMWQRQAITMAASIQQLHEAHRGPSGPLPQWLGGPNRGTATPTGWIPPGAGNVYTPPGQGQPPPITQGTAVPAGIEPTVINVYPQPQQSEESIATMVARRQAFALRS